MLLFFFVAFIGPYALAVVSGLWVYLVFLSNQSCLQCIDYGSSEVEAFFPAQIYTQDEVK